jgi:hypothetical protein
MTVKTLNQVQKDRVAQLYVSKEITCIKELAKLFYTSPRTIGRVLEERGLATPVPRLQGEAYRAMQLLKEHHVTVDQLKTMLEIRTNLRSQLGVVNPTITNARKQAALFQAPQQQTQYAGA